MTDRRQAFRAGIVALFAALVAGVASAQDASLPTKVPVGAKIVLADDANNAASLLKLSGEYDKLAADVSFANFTSGPLRLEAIRAGAAQVGAVGDVPPILAQYSGADVVIVGVVVTEGPTTIIATAPGSGIKELKDLKGKKIGINPGTAQQAIVFRNLRSVGLTANDIVPINLGLAEFADALRADQIDVAVLKQPDRARYLKSVAGTNAIELDNAPESNKNLKILYASKTALADPAQAAAIRDLVVHWYRAHLWKNDHLDVWKSEYLQKDQRLSEADAKSVIESETGKSRIPDWKSEIIPRQQDTIDLLQSAGQFKGRVLKAEDEFDLRFDGLSDKSKSATELHTDG
ncbi:MULTISPECIES: ABC transporter substrate-binding protein [unclassified Mesorhizobium]|uniref:ABC transporter substrate-binding protein n=1 Tax=unclassified Mesorhizobium TaxID=325217 RepID=UPI000FD3902E|nr:MULTISPECIES: ABC transporter substrate-binding protein [unclassified Mesorhizobium]RVB73273.1 transporter substrate-binding domain-containing protein [Mesorhizobium sp. M6A.T.Cr.TU.014.01.1.1]RWP77566.1 MAG: transporter substrate-binding domain-containing protein [Mesorhizobium sp.]RWQ02159.1 MAG: transporter substrate-binding domain-containing protein [Mesorhizobium sp.]RWQ09795.1 MAG: transporter substrate-binding domain-containing protein [Mesorhizobium sp.]